MNSHIIDNHHFEEDEQEQNLLSLPSDVINNNDQDEEDIKLDSYIILLCLSAAIGALLFGYDTGVISSALVNIDSDIGGHPLENSEAEWVTASLSVGALFGGIISCQLVDRIGRKLVLGIADFIFVVGALLIAFSSTLATLISGRLILGIAVGISSSTTPIYITELAPTKLRGSLMTVQSLAITFGQVLAYMFGALMTFSGAWRILFGVSIIPALIQASMIHWLPESPRYRILKGQDELAKVSLAKLFRHSTQQQLDNKVRIIKANVKQSRRIQENYSTFEIISILLKNPSYFRPAFVAFFTMLSQQTCGFNSLNYSATIFSLAGFSNGAATGIIVALTNFLFTGVVMMLIDRVGKRRLLLLSNIGVFMGLIMSSISFHYMTKSTDGKLLEGHQYPTSWTNAVLITMVIVIAFYAVGLGTIPWHCIEFFPLEVRGLAGSVILNTSNWTGNIIISSQFLSMLDTLGASKTFGLFAIFCFFGFLIAYFCYPDVTSLSLEEVQSIFQNSFGVKEADLLRMRNNTSARKHSSESLSESQQTSP